MKDSDEVVAKEVSTVKAWTSILLAAAEEAEVELEAASLTAKIGAGAGAGAALASGCGCEFSVLLNIAEKINEIRT